jgi:hypothetical protein
MIGRDVPLQAELVEQRLLRHPPLAHHPAARSGSTTANRLAFAVPKTAQRPSPAAVCDRLC